MRQFSEDEAVDFVVIGTGAGGGPLLAGLAEGGFSVVGFDASPYFRPLEDFASDELEQDIAALPAGMVQVAQRPWLRRRLAAGLAGDVGPAKPAEHQANRSEKSGKFRSLFGRAREALSRTSVAPLFRFLSDGRFCMLIDPA